MDWIYIQIYSNIFIHSAPGLLVLSYSLNIYVSQAAETHVAFEEPLLGDDDHQMEEGEQTEREKGEGGGAESGEEKMDEMKVWWLLNCYWGWPGRFTYTQV